MLYSFIMLTKDIRKIEEGMKRWNDYKGKSRGVVERLVELAEVMDMS